MISELGLRTVDERSEMNELKELRVVLISECRSVARE